MTIDEAIKELKNSNYLTNSEELQIAEWLEELKVYQQHEIICNNGYNVGYNKGCNVGYNKAIDDFVNIVKEHDFKYGKKDITNCVICFIEFFAEQLKNRR